MSEISSTLKAFVSFLVSSAFLFCFILFLMKDIYSDGYKPEHLFPYKPLILWTLIIYGILNTMGLLAGIFICLYKRKKAALLGLLLAYLIVLLYLGYFLQLWVHYWDSMA